MTYILSLHIKYKKYVHAKTDTTYSFEYTHILVIYVHGSLSYVASPALPDSPHAILTLLEEETFLLVAVGFVSLQLVEAVASRAAVAVCGLMEHK